jgi:hypothetical protein
MVVDGNKSNPQLMTHEKYEKVEDDTADFYCF